MTISEIVSFLNSIGFGKREGSYRLSLSHIPFHVMFVLLWYALLFVVAKECRFNIKLDLLALQGLGKAFEVVFDRRYEYVEGCVSVDKLS